MILCFPPDTLNALPLDAITFRTLTKVYKASNIPERKTIGEVTLFPLTYVSVPSHGSRMTHPVQDKDYTAITTNHLINI